MRFPICLLIFVTLASTSVSVATAQERVEDSTYGFSFPAPDSPWIRTKGLTPDDLYTYARPAADGTACYLDLRKLNDLMPTDGSDVKQIVDHPDEFIQKSHLPTNTVISLLTGTCHGRTVYGITMSMHNDAHSVITEMYSVPLLPNAVQVLVSGPISERAEMEEMLQKTLGGFDGRTYPMNVTTDPVPRWWHLAVALFQFLAVLGFICLIRLVFKSKTPAPFKSEEVK
jgi:hypothetical protein